MEIINTNTAQKVRKPTIARHLLYVLKHNFFYPFIVAESIKIGNFAQKVRLINFTLKQQLFYEEAQFLCRSINFESVCNRQHN